VTAIKPGLLPVFKAGVTKYFLPPGHRGEPVRWGHFLRLPGPIRNPLHKGYRDLHHPCGRNLSGLPAADQSWEQSVSVGQRLRPRFLRAYGRIVEKRATRGLRRRGIASSAPTAAAFMWNSIRLDRARSSVCRPTGGPSRSLMSLPHSGGWEYGYTPEPRQPRALAAPILFQQPAPKTGGSDEYYLRLCMHSRTHQRLFCAEPC